MSEHYKLAAAWTVFKCVVDIKTLCFRVFVGGEESGEPGGHGGTHTVFLHAGGGRGLVRPKATAKSSRPLVGPRRRL